MADENKNKELSFLDEKKGPKIHVKDVLFILLRNLHWLIICGALGAVIAGYTVRHQNRVYMSSARVLIKGSSTGSGDNAMREASVKNMFSTRSLYNSSINNEMMILTSKSAMLEVAQNLKLNIRYTTKTRIIGREKDLYGESPFTVDFIDNGEEDYAAFDIIAKNEKTYDIHLGENYDPIHAAFGDTVATPFGRVVVNTTWFFNNEASATPVHVEHNSMLATAERYRAALRVGRDDDFNTIINIVLQDASPIRAAEVINEVIRVYNDDAIKDRKRIIAYTYDYINERLKLLQTDLGIQENALAGFKREHQLLDLSSFGQSYLATSIQSSEEIERLRKQLSMARYLIQTNESGEDAHLIPPTSVLDDENIMQMIAQYNALVLELERYDTPNNPTVKAKQAELNQLRIKMNRMLDVYIGVLQERIADAQIVASSASSKMNQVPQQQLYIENLERTQKIKEELYLHLLSRREELMISQPSIEPNGKILDPARINRSPIAPNERKTTLMGLLIGLAIPVGIFFLRRLFDTKVKYYNDVLNGTTAPFLCEIPGRAKDDTRDLVVDNGDHDVMSESFRLLRTKVDFLGVNTKTDEKKGKVIMITSLMAGMGKTFISSNLAASFGMAGKRIIVIDLDLRRGSMTRKFYSRKHAGISSYLAGKTDDWQSLIKKDLIFKGVDSLFTGPIPPNPTELLGNGRFDSLMDELRKDYEYIILDTAPTGLVVDTDILKPHIDTALFIIRAGKFDKRMLAGIEDLYQTNAFPNISIVLNDVHYKKLMPLEKKYGYGYGYGYGDGDDENMEEKVKKKEKNIQKNA